MYETIVVPLDGSEQAELALPYAEEISGRIGSRIILLSILESSDVREYQEHQQYIEKMIERTKHGAEMYLDRFMENKVEVGSATRVGYPAEGIIDYTSSGGFKFIIMSTHGRSGLGGWALGSVADKVVRNMTKQPLMLIRAADESSCAGEYGILKKALVTLDGSRASEVVLPYIHELASKLKMEITLLKVVQPGKYNSKDDETYLKKISNSFAKVGVVTNYQLRSGNAANEIITLANELDVDMVAMSTHGRTGISRLVIGSVAHKVLLGGSTPLMLVRS